MNKKRLLITSVVMAALALLVYLQIRHWQKFDWEKFWQQTHHVNLLYILAGVALIYADYFLRALRWQILLRPVRQVNAASLVAPTMIGFTGLALLGRPGELIRPFLIARRHGLRMSSQMAVWIVERIFDMGAFAVIMAVNILVYANEIKELPGFANGSSRAVLGHHISSFALFQIAAAGLLCGVGLAAACAYLIRKNPAAAALFVRHLLRPLSPKLAAAVSHRVHVFGEGLNTVPDLKSFLQLSTISLVIWLFIGFTYLLVTHAYTGHRISSLPLSSVLLLTTASVIGGVLQLPVVGGGSQLATIGTLHGIFGFSPELSTSCGMMLWLVTFMSVIPAGLALARYEHVSLLRMEKESLAEEKTIQSTG